MIESKQNPQIKAIKKLQQAKGRRKAKRYVLEGPHLLEMALEAGCQPDLILCTEASFIPDYAEYSYELISPQLADYLAETQTTQAVFAVMPLADSLTLDQLTSPAILLLDGLQDPGNLGTIIRTADALGYHSLILGKGSVDPYNAKALRAMQGSQFNLQVIQADLNQAIPQLQAKGYQIAASTLSRDSKSVRDYCLTDAQKWGIILGNEGNGVSPEVIELADVSLHIPMTGQAESLNVAIAAAIMMYEYRPVI
ncbi:MULTISPECIES: RNA methyltransferase [Aerococcus]|uniref:RNA methyltransferase n=1 Tax=Aerococcus sanguinicola TaxID=119206 RepID=A0A5N1GP52_9LACT|nr:MULTISPECIES: RNA methyltransferase [Aerococcus]KAA9302106.1 RNA methyltransferase [Aerococcus sanguinicola]MDK6368465.1 RNA methyltransferase [Aerococcus sp. UMB9870]MDK6679548.1 RNA methyltransferase [Aerococcus sp. UMB8608]MDK6686392.1 RNA methyltransferase [Aerococcus sp. UMB8623]MDK6940986.1 RNA methyltransferase [Aerococcus sp. UMB8487]